MRQCPQCGYVPDHQGRKIHPDQYVEIERLYSIEGLTLQEIGDRYGVSRERIRQILPRGVSEIKRRRKRAEARTGYFLAACQRALDGDLHCRTCGGWILRKTSGPVPPRTCSAECASAYLVLRNFDDHQAHRHQMAKVYLASPEKYKESHLEWAKAMLGANPPPPNRRYLIPGSKRSEVIRKYRPEQYAALTGTPAA